MCFCFFTVILQTFSEDCLHAQTLSVCDNWQNVAARYEVILEVLSFLPMQLFRADDDTEVVQTTAMGSELVIEPTRVGASKTSFNHDPHYTCHIHAQA